MCNKINNANYDNNLVPVVSKTLPEVKQRSEKMTTYGTFDVRWFYGFLDGTTNRHLFRYDVHQGGGGEKKTTTHKASTETWKIMFVVSVQKQILSEEEVTDNTSSKIFALIAEEIQSICGWKTVSLLFIDQCSETDRSSHMKGNMCSSACPVCTQTLRRSNLTG